MVNSVLRNIQNKFFSDRSEETVKDNAHPNSKLKPVLSNTKKTNLTHNKHRKTKIKTTKGNGSKTNPRTKAKLKSNSEPQVYSWWIKKKKPKVVEIEACKFARKFLFEDCKLKTSLNLKEFDNTDNAKDFSFLERLYASMLTDVCPKGSRFVAIDCEMVGGGIGARISMLARVSIVDYCGNTLLDEYVKPEQKVTDYRTGVSGITETHLRNAKDFKNVVEKVKKIIKNKTIVGHSLDNDLKILKITELVSPKNIIDTTRIPGLSKIASNKLSLRNLVYNFFDFVIQEGCHCSVIDAVTTMAVFRFVEPLWHTENINEIFMKEFARIKAISSE